MICIYSYTEGICMSKKTTFVATSLGNGSKLTTIPCAVFW